MSVTQKEGLRGYKYWELVERDAFIADFRELCRRYDIAMQTCGCCDGHTKYSDEQFDKTIGYFV